LAIFKVFDPFQDLLPRGSSIAIGAFQFIDLRLEAASPLSAQSPSSFGRITTKSIWRMRAHSPILGASTVLSESFRC
jgi:hypothetical protein